MSQQAFAELHDATIANLFEQSMHPMFHLLRHRLPGKRHRAQLWPVGVEAEETESCSKSWSRFGLLSAGSILQESAEIIGFMFVQQMVSQVVAELDYAGLATTEAKSSDRQPSSNQS